MALRLTDLSSRAAPKRRLTPAMFAPRADACLRAGDLPGFRALWAEVQEIDDHNGRYVTRRMLAERGMVAAARGSRVASAATYLAVGECVVELLEQEPREPVLVNYAGVALYELGALKAAHWLFEAALRLDPTLADVRGNIKEIGRRLRSGTRMERLPPVVSVALPALAERARRCAERARPAEGLTLSLCMIVKDEEEMLPRCLEAVAGAVDEIVVVDTGSNDRSLEIATSFGARVIHHEWTGSFAEARNVSFAAATGDWVMYLDADEVLLREDAERLRALTGRVWREAFYLVETNFTGEFDAGTNVVHNALRVFRNRPDYRFEGCIHEQIGHTLPRSIPERIEVSQVRVEHYGYLGSVRDAKDKSRRNLELLERQVAEGIDTPFLHYNVGSEHLAMEDPAKALEHFERSWAGLRGSAGLDENPFVPSLVSRRVRTLRETGDLDGCDEAVREGLRIFPGFTDLVFEQAMTANERGDSQRAVELLERCLEMGDAPSRYTAVAGAGTYLAMMQLAAVHRERGAFEEAEDLLTRCLIDHPGYGGAAASLAQTMLGRGADADEVLAALAARVRSITPSVRFLVGTALYEAGHREEALGEFRQVLERHPTTDAVRVATGETLLSMRRYAEAAEVCSSGREGAGSQSGWRTELFARLAGGDLEGAAQAIAEARSAGLPHPDSALFAAWLRVAESHAAGTSEASVGVLPASAADLLAVVLEALLRVEEVDHFAALVPFVETVGLPWRERRQLLAGMYMRRGYLDSAADEWIDVCQTAGADVAALLGLAQVAVARGLHEEALMLADEIQALEPAHPAAGRLRDALGGP